MSLEAGQAAVVSLIRNASGALPTKLSLMRIDKTGFQGKAPVFAFNGVW